MTTTPTIYPPLPWCAPRGADEPAESYGLRALLFVTAERIAATVDTEGLELAAHTFRVAVSNPEIHPPAAERLADVLSLITGTLARRVAAETQAQTAQAQAAPVADDRPNLGPMAPLAPPPVRPTPPVSGLQQPVTVDTLRNPQRIAAALTVPAAQAPAARPAFQPVARPVVRPAAPVAPQVSAAEWGF